MHSLLCNWQHEQKIHPESLMSTIFGKGVNDGLRRYEGVVDITTCYADDVSE